MLNPKIHVSSMNFEVVMPRGTATQVALQAAGRIVDATRDLVARELRAEVTANDFYTYIRFEGVEFHPLADARDFFDIVEHSAQPVSG
jgi:hypothetical protein